MLCRSSICVCYCACLLSLRANLFDRHYERSRGTYQNFIARCEATQQSGFVFCGSVIWICLEFGAWYLGFMPDTFHAQRDTKFATVSTHRLHKSGYLLSAPTLGHRFQQRSHFL